VHSPVPEGKTPVITQWGWPDVDARWNWAGNEGKTFQVDVYSAAEKVELFLNGRSLGEKPTTLAEKQSPAEFSRLIDRFYTATSKVLYKKNALLEKLIGDEVTAFFVPGVAGPQHARLAIEAGEEILRATGHADRRHGRNAHAGHARRSGDTRDAGHARSRADR
jgi:hypothetical protein